MSLFGLDSAKQIIISSGVAFQVCLPIFEHDYICVGSNLCSSVQAMQAGSKVEATNLRTIMPLVKYYTRTESYSPPSASSRTEVVATTIDCIELLFTDKFGNPIRF